MTSVSCATDMRSFHDKRVSLTTTEQAEMRERRDNSRIRLATGLTANGDPLPAVTASQGSYQMRTMVQDDESDYDIDDGVYFAMVDLVNSNGEALSAPAARERVRDALVRDQRLSMPAKCRTNCVRQEYPAGYHVDIPVYRISVNDDDEETFELASGDFWTVSDARAVTSWFNGEVRRLNAEGELKQGERDGSQLRRVTRLTKKFSRRSKSWKRNTASGICLSKLVVDNFVASDVGDDEALRSTWLAIDAYLQTSTRVLHPVEGCLPIAEGDDETVEFFHDCLESALDDLVVLDEEGCDLAEARRAWDRVFKTKFFSERETSEPDSGARKSIVTAISTEQLRDDGGGRFG